uniref:Uncharacterized protein n=1 Tax=Haemonchus contortus TaxID=6289 RepID=A0A7I4Y497_HAECO
MLKILLSLFVCSKGSIFEKNEVEIDVKNSPYYKEGVFNLPMSEDSGNELYQHWVDQAFSSLMAALATERLPNVPETERKRHHKCAKNADDIQAHAKCVSMLLEAEAEEAKRTRWMKLFGKRRVMARVRLPPSSLVRRLDVRLLHLWRNKGLGLKKINVKRKLRPKAPALRHKREVLTRSSYNLIDKDNRTVFGHIARHLTKTVRSLKNQKSRKSWQEVVSDIKQLVEKEHEKRELEEKLKKRMHFFKKAATAYEEGKLSRKKSGKRSLSKLHHLENVLKHEHFDQMELMKREYKKRKESLKPIDQAVAEPIKLVREGAKLAMMLAGQNASGFEDKTVKMISPRIMSLLPEDENTSTKEVNMFSPSLFSLHNQGNGIERLTSLPNLLNLTGLLDHRDQQDWMDFVIETSGAGDVLEKAKEKKANQTASNDVRRIRGPDGQPIYLTKKNVTELFGKEQTSRIEVFEQLQKSFTPMQEREMNRTGYAILTPAQREFFYGPSSPYNNSAKLNLIRNVSDSDVHRTVRDTVRGIAEGRLQFEAKNGAVKLVTKPQPRHKRAIVLSPISGLFINDPVSVSQPVILSPVYLSALVCSPAIFGVVVLSPWLFIPVVLSPRIFSPVILSPFAFVPIILTPLAFVPVILSPGIMNPFVLSPLVLSPFILSPQVMTPLILTPFALSPFIGTPNVLSPLVLSPFVLSPIIFSPAYVTAFVLSPYALSPVINSTGAIFTSIASPSWLS